MIFYHDASGSMRLTLWQVVEKSCGTLWHKGWMTFKVGGVFFLGEASMMARISNLISKKSWPPKSVHSER
jgi:hypothetical protein